MYNDDNKSCYNHCKLQITLCPFQDSKPKVPELVDITSMLERVEIADNTTQQALDALSRNFAQSRRVSSSGPVRARQMAQQQGLQQQGLQQQQQGMRSDGVSGPRAAADMKALADKSRSSYSDARSQQDQLQAQVRCALV